MKKEFLKIAGVKSEKDFYKKYPTEEAFFKAHPEALKMMAKGGEAYPQTATMDNFFSYGVPVPPTYYAHGGAFPMAQPEAMFFSPGYGTVYNPYNKAMGGNTEAYPQAIPYGNLGTSKAFYFMQEGGGSAAADQLMQQVANALQQGADPKEAVQFLVSKGVPQQNAVKIVQGIMSQMAGAQQQQAQPGQQPMQQEAMQQEPPMEQPQMDFGGSSDMDMGVKNKTGFFTGLVKATAGNAANKNLIKSAQTNVESAMGMFPRKQKYGGLLMAKNGIANPTGGYSDPGAYAAANPIDAVLANQYMYDPSYSGALGNFIDSAYKSYYELPSDYDISALKADPIYNQLYGAYGFTPPTPASTATNTNQNQNQNQNQTMTVQNPYMQAYIPGLYDPYNTNQFVVTSDRNMPVKYKVFDNAGNKLDSGRYNQPLIYGMYPELHGTSGIIDPNQVLNTPRAKELGLVGYEENLAGSGWFARNFMRNKRKYYFDTTTNNTPTNLPGSPNASNANTPATTTNIPPYLAAPANPNAPAPAWSPANIYQPPKSTPFQGPNVTVPYLPGFMSPSATNAPGSPNAPVAPSAPGSPGATGPSTIPGVNVPPYQTGPMGPILPNIPGVNMPGLTAPAPYMPSSIIPYAPGTNPPPSIPGVDPGPFSIDAIDNALQQQIQQQTQQGPLLLPGMINYDPSQSTFNQQFTTDPASVAARNLNAPTPTVAQNRGFDQSDVVNVAEGITSPERGAPTNVPGYKVEMDVNKFVEEANLGNYQLEPGTVYSVGEKGKSNQFVVKMDDGRILNFASPFTAQKFARETIGNMLQPGVSTMPPPTDVKTYTSRDEKYTTTTPPYMTKDPNFMSFFRPGATPAENDQRIRNFIDYKADELISNDPNLTKKEAEKLIIANPEEYDLTTDKDLKKLMKDVKPKWVNPTIYGNVDRLPETYTEPIFTGSDIPFSGQEVPLSGGFQSGSLPSGSTNFRTGQTVDRYSGETTYMVYDPDDINSVIATGKTPEAAMAKAQKKFDKRRRKQKAYGGLVQAKGGLEFSNAYKFKDAFKPFGMNSSTYPNTNNLTTNYDVMIADNEITPAGQVVRNVRDFAKDNAFYVGAGLTAGLADIFSNSAAMQARKGANDPRQLYAQNLESIQGAMPTTQGTFIMNTNDNFMGPEYNRSDIRYDVAPRDSRMPMTRMGGAIKEGEIVDMTPEEIAEFVKMGGQIEYLR